MEVWGEGVSPRPWRAGRPPHPARPSPAPSSLTALHLASFSQTHRTPPDTGLSPLHTSFYLFLTPALGGSSPLHRWDSWGSARLAHSPRAAQLTRGRTPALARTPLTSRPRFHTCAPLSGQGMFLEQPHPRLDSPPGTES